MAKLQDIMPLGVWAEFTQIETYSEAAMSEQGDFGAMVSESMGEKKPLYHGLAKPPPSSPPIAKDMVNLPNHYARFKIEPIRFLVENDLDPLRFNAIKYTMRADSKHPTKLQKWEDVLKAIRCLYMWGLKNIDENPDWWKAGREGEDPSVNLAKQVKERYANG